MNEGMTNAEFNAFLETLAQLIEANRSKGRNAGRSGGDRPKGKGLK